MLLHFHLKCLSQLRWQVQLHPAKDHGKEDRQESGRVFSSFQFILFVPEEPKPSPWYVLYSIWATSDKHQLYWSPPERKFTVQTHSSTKKTFPSMLLAVHTPPLLPFIKKEEKNLNQPKQTKTSSHHHLYLKHTIYTYVLYWNKNRL